MLTIKNRRAGDLATLFLALGIVAFAAGCKPAGTRALLAGKKFLEQGKIEPAVEQFRTATTLLTTNAIAWNYLALAQHAAGRANEAAVAYQKALALNPGLVEAHYNFGCLLLEQNNPGAARTEFASYVGSRPKDFNAWLKLGAAQTRLKDWANAERSYSEALRVNSQLSEAWNALGLIQLQRANPSEAAKYFDAALRFQPDYAPALLNSAIVAHQHLNNRPLALQKYRAYAALKSAPNQEAVATLARALDAELNPPAPPVAIATNPVVKPPTVVAVVKPVTPPQNPIPPRPPVKPPVTPPVVPPLVPPVAVVLPKTNPPVATNIARVDPTRTWPEVTPLPGTTNVSVTVTSAPPRVSTPVTPPPKAIARYGYRSPAKPKPGNRAAAEPALEQGLLAQQRRQLPEALAAFELAVKADPAYFKAHYNLAWTAYALKDWPVALEAYEYALVLDPESPNARYNFALALKQAGYPLDAVNELSKLLAKKSDDAAAHLLTANLYAQQLGGPALARPHYLRVLELEPDHPQGTQIRYWLTENP